MAGRNCSLEREIEKSIAEVIMEMGLKRYRASYPLP